MQTSSVKNDVKILTINWTLYSLETISGPFPAPSLQAAYLQAAAGFFLLRGTAPYREICGALAVNGFSPDYTVPEKATPTEAEQSDAASVQEVHQTFSMLLSMLTLIPAHRAHLQSVRGLPETGHLVSRLQAKAHRRIHGVCALLLGKRQGFGTNTSHPQYGPLPEVERSFGLS